MSAEPTAKITGTAPPTPEQEAELLASIRRSGQIWMDLAVALSVVRHDVLARILQAASSGAVREKAAADPLDWPEIIARVEEARIARARTEMRGAVMVRVDEAPKKAPEVHVWLESSFGRIIRSKRSGIGSLANPSR